MALKQEITQELIKHMIPFWEKLRDDEFGGFYGEMGFDLIINKKAEKGCILNSRILWFFSKAYFILKDEKLLSYAKHAYDFLMANCIDDEFGGVFWSVSYDGKVTDTTKHTYNQAFAIYALSAYFEATGNDTALKTALKLFDLIQHKCTDNDGYLEAFTQNWQTESNDKLSENGVIAERTMNTLLHVFEGYSGLYEVSHNEEVGNRIRRIIMIFIDKIYNPNKHRQDVFFDADYNSLIDLHSYGHDIETAWLIDWGSKLLNDEAINIKLAPIIDDLVDTVYHKALVNGAVYIECENGIDDKTRVWWAQCEAIVGFINSFDKHPEHTEYMRAAEDIWEYIKAHLIDKRNGGEWFWEVDDNGEPTSRRMIVEPWKCPYHSGRMCFEVIRRL